MRRPSPSGSLERTRPTPSTCPCTMWPPSSSPSRSAGSTLTSAARLERAQRRARERLRHDVERECRLVARRRPSAHAVHGDRVADSRLDRRLEDEPAVVERGDATALADDAGEHRSKARSAQSDGVERLAHDAARDAHAAVSATPPPARRGAPAPPRPPHRRARSCRSPRAGCGARTAPAPNASHSESSVTMASLRARGHRR